MKTMPILSIIAGVVLIVAGILSLSASDPKQESVAPKPKSNDKRIVERGGEFVIEYYSEDPGWHSFSGRHQTEEAARDFAKKAFGPYAPDRVVELLPSR